MTDISGVAKENRGTIDTYRLFRYMVEQENNYSMEKVRSTTWSDNAESIKLHEGFGFEEVGRKENDIIPGRTTILYEVDMGTFRNYFRKRL